MTRIGVSTAAYYGCLETEDAAARLAALGLPCCEVFLETFSEYTPAFGAMVRQRLGDTRAVSVHCQTMQFEIGFFGQSPRQREDAFALLDGFLGAGAALGAGIYVYHGLPHLRGGAPDLARWRPVIERVMARAAEFGLALCWEVVSWCYLTSPERVRAFREVWPGLGFVMDIKQVFELGHSPLDYVKAMGGALRHVHILDVDADGRLVLPGEGMHDFRELATALRDMGYQGDIILEPYAQAVRDDAALMASVDWLRDTFGAE